LKKDEEMVKRKVEEQMQNLGHVCSKLQCAIKENIGYCMKDCSEFPCKLYEEHPFPYSEDFLKMYKARNRQSKRGHKENGE
jgi:hypothetical protein